jgi:peroxiredoxin
MVKYLVVFMLVLANLACEKETKLKTHGPAKNFILFDVDSVRYELKDYRGKIVMVHFWADWCPNCRGEFPKIQQAYEKMDKKDFEILAVNSGQSKAHVREIKETYGLTYPLLLDREGRTAKLYEVAGLPSTFFVDKSGMIKKVNVGWLESEDIFKTYELLKNEAMK